MKEKRVLVIATTHLGYEGITSVIMNFYRNINKNKIQYDFVLGCGAMDWVKKEITDLGGNLYNISRRNKNPIKYIYELEKIIKNNNYEIVHAHGNSGTLFLEAYAAKKSGVKLIITHSHNSTCSHKIIHKLFKRKLNKLVDRKVACSNVAGKWLYNGNFTVINNGINLMKFTFDEEVRNSYRNKLNLNGKFVIGHIGHFSYQKNHEFIINIFEKIHYLDRNSVLMLIGDGGLRKEIEKKAKEKGLYEKILFLGKRADVNNLIQCMDTFILPSRFEGLPVSLVEAQTSGLKCYVSNMVTDEAQITGRVEYISLEESPQKWAKKILQAKKKYIRDDILESIVNSKYNIKNVARDLENIYLDNI